jgi:signal peptidase II
MFSVKPKYRTLFACALLSVALDQFTKHWVHTHFQWGESFPVLNSVFALTYVRNTGAAFGLFHRAPPSFREPFFLAVPFLALGVIAVLFSKLREGQSWSAIALSLIVGGAVGNLIDRVRFGYVIDFLDVHWKEVYHWPAFNVADSCIVAGVAILFILSLNKPASFQTSH